MAEAIEEYFSTRTYALPETSSPRYHVVRRGETLWHIARTYDIEVTELRKINHLALKEPIQVGQKLQIPAK